MNFCCCKKNSEILYFTYDTLFAKCECTCSFHKELINNLSELFLDEIIRLNLRVELLTKRNTRDKLLSYFDILSKSSMRKTFTLPYNYTDLADFLSVDRSAMMRELKLLIDEGFVEKMVLKLHYYINKEGALYPFPFIKQTIALVCKKLIFFMHLSICQKTIQVFNAICIISLAKSTQIICKTFIIWTIINNSFIIRNFPLV